MNFCLFAVFSEGFKEIDDLIGRIGGLYKAHIYTPERAHDPFLNDGAPPPMMLQLYFASLQQLEAACAGPLKIVNQQCEVDAMLVRPFSIPEPDSPGCTYLVAYEGTAENEIAWHAHYLEHHPRLMAQLPGLRELEIYTPVIWVTDAGWRRRRCMQRNKVAFDNPAALTVALNSSVREAMRRDYLSLPPFSGQVTHYPMATRVVYGRNHDSQ